MTKIDQLLTKRDSAKVGGGQQKIEIQHSKGKMTARERIAYLLDTDTFQEINSFVAHRAHMFGMDKSQPMTDGVVTGWGKIDGRTIYVYAQDFTVLGGSLGEAHGMKIARVMQMAAQNGAPVIGLNDSGGARIQEGVDSLAAYGEIFYQNTQASGVVPQISVIMGPCAGGAVYSPAITDFIFMVEKSANMFITGPQVVKAVTFEDVDAESLGGAKAHTSKSGVADFSATTENEVLNQVKALLAFIPDNNLSSAPFRATADDRARLTPKVQEIIPENPGKPYDIHAVIKEVMDDGQFMEVAAKYAPNVVVGFAHLNGQSVGIVANQPFYQAGVLDINGSDKGARFIRFCDAFHIPLITFVDTPGFLPGVDQEHGGIIRHGAKMIYAYAEATVPKISIILRKAYGGAYIVMSSKHLRGDINFALPNAEIAVMGPEGAVNIVFRKEIQAAGDAESARQQYIDEYREELANPYVAASRGYIDDVILPEECRQKLIQALEVNQQKKVGTPARKHGNIPL
ncbi:MAG: acyl-CoA carboxylase subunit beta [Anaerolineaceae bacterium]|nr:acyl-CoA carboxylase subunit beta [Anaerolineaceae bacterium]